MVLGVVVIEGDGVSGIDDCSYDAVDVIEGDIIDELFAEEVVVDGEVHKGKTTI
jgi:hypothetical protein